MNILYVQLCWVLLVLTTNYSVYGGNSSDLDIYKYPKSTWADDEIVFALNLPFKLCSECRNKISGSGYNTAQYYAAAAAVAVEDINNNPNILKGYKLRYVWNQNKTDTHCNEREAIRIQLKQMNIGVHGFIGFTCSCLTVAKNAAAMNLPLFSMSCSETALSDKKQYPTFARTAAINNEVVYMITSLFEKFKWKTFAVVYEETHLWQPIYNALSTSNGKFRITLEVKYEKHEAYQDNRGESLEHKFGPFLDKLPTKARVVLLLIDKGFLSEFLFMAAEKGLTDSEYAFIAIHPFATSEGILHHSHPMKGVAWFLPWRIPKYNMTDTDSLKRITKAYQSLMILMPEFPPLVKNDSYRDFQKRVLNGMANPPFYAENSYQGKIPHAAKARNNSMPPSEAARLYDAVMLYAVGLNKSVAKGQGITNGTAIVENIKGLKLTSIVGQRFIVNGKADVQTFFDVLQFQLSNATKPIFECMVCWSPKKIFNLIPVYNASRPDLTIELIEIEGRKPYWRHGLPVDVPVCGFYNEKCQEKGISHIILALVISVTILAVIMIVVLIFLYRNYHLRKELNNLMWKIEPSDLYFHDWRGASASSLGSLTSQTLTMNFETSNNQRFTTVAIFKGAYVAIKKVNRKSVELTNPILLELKQMRDVRHCNLNQFIGACVEPNNIMIIYQYAAKGSLQDMLENSEIKLDTLFILSLVYDIVKGMIYLHSTDIKTHGNLKSSNCVVDSRWVLKVTDYGLKTFKNGNNTSETNCNNLLWKAPELLRSNDSASFNGSQKGDIYSFAIILQECQTRDGAWGSACQDPETIVERVRKCSNPPFRPIVPQLLDGAEGLRDVMKRCWVENPDDRPSFSEIRKDVEVMMKANGLKTNIFDNMVYMMGKYTDNLEDIVEERTSSLIDEKHKVEALLERMLPQSVARQLMKGKEVEAEAFEEVTIYFSDIVGFTNICSSITPMEVVDLLNCLYTMFDSAANDYDVYKVETIGDAYMVVSGLPVRNGKQHVKEICLFALDILENVQSFKARYCDQQLKIRIGVHCGPVVAGVVGTTMPRYCLFGDTVNVAARMESTGQAFRIHISKYVKDALACFQGFSTESRGLTEVKGKGELETYWLTGIDPGFSHRGSNLKSNQRNLYHCPNNSSIYNFIRESPRNKHNYPKSHAMTDYLPRSPLVPRLESASGELSRKNKKDHVNGFGPFLPSGLCKKKENSESKGGAYMELLDNVNDEDTNQLLKTRINSYVFPNSEKEPTESDPLSTDLIEIKL